MRLSACTEWLFFHLWKSNPENGKSCEGVIIPETVIFRFFLWNIKDGLGHIFGILQTLKVELLEKLKKKFNLLIFMMYLLRTWNPKIFVL